MSHTDRSDLTTWCDVDVAALHHNARTLRRRLRPGARLGVVVKADAYGHGLGVVAPALAPHIDLLIVNSADEAVAARAAVASTAHAAGEDETAWTTTLKPQFFADKTIDETNPPLEITAPYRAEDPALVPLQITSKIPQTPEHYIKHVTLIIDNTYGSIRKAGT